LLFNHYFDAKAHRSIQYRKQLGWTRDRFPQLHNQLATDITPGELEQVLKPLSPGARNPVMRCLRAVFNHGLKRGLVLENPVSRLDFVERPRGEVETIANQHVAGMLEHALSQDLELYLSWCSVFSAESGPTANCKSCNGRTSTSLAPSAPL